MIFVSCLGARIIEKPLLSMRLDVSGDRSHVKSDHQVAVTVKYNGGGDLVSIHRLSFRRQ